MTTGIITTFIQREADPRKHSAAYKIFHYEWAAAVPMMFVYSDDYIRNSGQVISDPVYDRNLPRQFVEGRYTIDNLARLLDEGAPIRLTIPEDSKRIYDIVLQHLEDWSTKLTTASAFDLNKAPTEELLLYSQLADHLMGFARRYFKDQAPAGSLARKLEMMRGRFGLRGTRRWTDPKKVKPEEKKQMREHGEYTKNILSQGSGRDRWS